ncbi:55_t:CDS:1 [Cetraspora pellucida]|uniref:55_t:CDS:1 n=1 Tax=Cetraspora pellucida TaxID=1433469 RepID=A0A9N9H867_9GLOM|nr:55_t:CDS:1 [Cetraspora pellucida]
MPFFERKQQQNQKNGDAGHQRKISTSTIPTISKRRIYVNLPLPATELDQYGEPKECYVTNKIRTSKYTLLTFLPKNLFEQFRRVANMYFLFLVILQLFPMIGSEVQPFIASMPLISIILMTALKDVFEDWKRHTQDKNLNRSKTTLLRNWRNVNIPANDMSSQQFLIKIWNGFFNLLGYRIGENLDNKVSYTAHTGAIWTESHWQDVKVGDIVKLKNNDAVPADMIILSTSEPDGLCYVETKNLDGETNLKVRHCVPSTISITTESDCENIAFYVESEQPHSNLYSYTGVLHRPDHGGTGNNIIDPISINDVLLRGCVLRNTQWAIGLVVFTGTDTKIMLNSGDTPSKRSRIEIETNFHVCSFVHLQEYQKMLFVPQLKNCVSLFP